MIRYPVSISKLKRLVDEADPRWRTDADELTGTFSAAGRYTDHNTIWRRVVRVFMTLQHNKCAFCERKLEGAETGGAREFDVEHFRPKSSVKVWPAAAHRAHLPADFPVSEGSPTGYFLLTYHLSNYTVACKPCNQAFKSNYFPIAGPRDTGGGDPRRMKAEKPYLLYPIGNVDADPERIVRYDGVLAVPAPKSGHRHRRALATIVFFGLNQREEHLAERAEKISHLYVSLGSLSSSDAFARRHARVIVNHLCSARSSHTNCMRSFRKLYESEPTRARRVVEHVQRYLKTTS